MRKTRLFILIAIMVLCLSFVFGLTYAWIGDNGMTSPIGLTAHLHKSYFESGDGSKDYVLDGNGNIVQSETGPFEIKYPIQLYYLSWLQALGYFNTDENGDGNVDQYYFYLSADLDMSEKNFVLPPIGTQDYPFLGGFDGQGHMIYNLTIGNTNGDMTDAPQASNMTNVDIIGLFGVVGSLPDSTYTYDSAENEIKDFYISNVNIKTSHSNALIGIAAGYVNGKVSGVGVINSSIEFTGSSTALSYTTNLSDYSLIGYCTDEYKDNVHADRIELSEVLTGSDEYLEGDDGDSSGNSIPMQSIFTRIKNMYDSKSEVEDYAYEREIRYDQNNNQIYTGPLKSKTVYRYSSGNNGNALFADVSDTVMYLGGGSKVFEYYYTKSTVTGFYITDGTNYLTIDSNGAISNTTAKANASVWIMSGTSSGKIHTCDNKANSYYLNNSNGTLTISNTSDGATSWTKTTNQLYTSSGTRYYLTYNNGWVLTTSSSYTKYRFYMGSNTSRYVINNGTTGITATNTTNDSTYIWEYNKNNTSIEIFTYIDGTKYYLYITEASTPTVGLRTDSYSWTTNNSNKLYHSYTSGRYTYYVYFTTSNNNNNITPTRTRSNNVPNAVPTITFQGKQFTIDLTLSFETGTVDDYVLDDTKTKEYMDYSTLTNTSYIPLKADQTSYTVDANNSGYITAGMKSADYGDVRVSRYNSSSIGSNKTNPLTITFRTYQNSTPTSNATTSNATNLGLQKFVDSYNDYTSLVNGTYVYGLHFMSAYIDKNEYITIPQATIKGMDSTALTNFQVPVNCIDFTLAKSGFINFYAGTYYNGSTFGRNTAFFSLHQIFRSGNTITDIKEISKVYGIVKNNQIDTTEEYIYLYTDGTYSATLPGTYQMIFDMDWITTQTKSYNFTNDSAYYFEVPVNAGEFALGSVQDRQGAYLIYLDLQSNKQKVERTIVTETWKEEVISGEIPNGVALVAAKGDAIDEIDSATVKLGPGTTGKTTISRTGDAVTYTSTTGATAAFIGDGLTANGATDGSSKVTILTERLTYYDYNTTTKVTKIIVTTTTITTNADGTTTRASSQTIDGVANSSYTDDNHTITLGNTIAKWYYYDRTDATITTTIGYDYKTAPTVYNITIASNKDLTVTAQSLSNTYTIKLNNQTITSTETDYSVSGNGD